jgi:hypothetical protein
MKASRIGLFVVILSIYALILSYGQPAKPESSALSPWGRGESVEKQGTRPLTPGQEGEPIEREKGAAGKSGSPLPMPLRRVILYTNGTAYLERELEVSGAGYAELTVRATEVDDLLKSLVIYDPGKETAPTVTYATKEPLEKLLKSFSVNLTETPDVPSLLLQARGERVEIFAQDRFSGTLFGIEDRPVPGAGRISTKGEADSSPSEAPTEPFVTLYTDRGLTSIPLRKIKSLRFLNPSLDMEISTALQYLAENRNTDRKRILIRYGGASTRSLRLGYIVESPVWKTAFRLVLGEGQKHLLQGWAIVENPTDEDWNGVRLDLVSGRPISFSMNLYEPIYNPRPRIPYAVEKQAVPPVSSAGVTPGASPALPQAALKSAPSASASPQVKRSRIDTMAEALSDKSLTAKAEESGASSEIAQEGEEFLSPEKMGSGPRPEADAAAVGQFIRYTIQEPVTLPRRQAALLPILNASLEGERFSIYNESLNRKYPLSGFWLKNTSGLPLMGGPITVFEGGQYAGDGRIDTVSAGDRRLVSYAVDLEREVLFLDKTEPETITRVKIQKGTLYVSKVIRKERTYTLVNRGTDARNILIEHPVSADFQLVEPKTYEERTERVYRFRISLPPRQSSGTEFRVIEEKPLESTVTLTNLQTEGILFYLSQRAISRKVQEALTKVVALKNELSEATRTRQELETRITQITREQERIRSNMGVLDRTSTLYQRYLKTLNDQEDTLADLQKALLEARNTENSKRKAMENFLLNLEAE